MRKHQNNNPSKLNQNNEGLISLKGYDSDSKSNSNKAKAGITNSKNIKSFLENLQHEGVIDSFQQDVNLNHKGFPYPKQYLINFLIKLHEEKYIIVRRSNSFRSDRAKAFYYDINGVVNHTDFTGSIVASVFLVPDQEKNRKDFINHRDMMMNREMYNPFSHLLTHTEFIEFLENYRKDYEMLISVTELDQVESEDEKLIFGASLLNKQKEKKNYYDWNYDKIDISEINHEFYSSEPIVSYGSHVGKRGHKIAKSISETLNDKALLNKFKAKDLPTNSLYRLYSFILNPILGKINNKPEDIIKINSTTTVPLLRSGGNPKSDICLNFHTIDDNIKTVTMSIKVTDKEFVSCHEYSAYDFCRVLKISTSDPLFYYFKNFQKNPTYRDFEKSLRVDKTSLEFAALLGKREKEFSEWVISGMHDDENIIDPEAQIADFILFIYKGNEVALYTVDAYVQLLRSMSDEHKRFGVPFRWTYPSKRRGTRIQLKIPVRLKNN